MRISPVEPSLSVVISIDRGVDVEPVALIPHQRLTEGIMKRTVGGVGHQHANAVAVEWCIEIVLAVALYGLDGPATVLTRAPGEVLQRGHGTMLRPVHHVRRRPQQPVVHEEARRTLLVHIRDILGRGIV